MSDARTIIVSPHIDDAAYSLGGCLIGRLFGEVEIINVFSVSDYQSRGSGDIETVTDLRKQEDSIVLAPYAETVWLDFLEATLRPMRSRGSFLRKRTQYWEPLVARRVARDLKARLARNPVREVLFPAGVGQHRDHLMLFRIGLRLARAGLPVRFYLDMPYGSHIFGPADLPDEQRRYLGDMSVLRGCDCTRKDALIRGYESQADDNNFERTRDHFEQAGGEILFAV